MFASVILILAAFLFITCAWEPKKLIRRMRSGLPSIHAPIKKSSVAAVALASAILTPTGKGLTIDSASAASLTQSSTVSSIMLAADDSAVKKTVTLPSGVQYFDVTEGEGQPAEEGKTVQFLWVLRRSNGYFVDASSNYGDEPFIYRVGNTKKVIKGLDEGIRGMKPGGVRR